MTKQPEDWLDDVPGDDIEDEDDEIIWVSKSEIKRDAEELKRLGAELVDLGKNALDKIPLDADLRAAVVQSLELAGLKVVACASGQEALSRLPKDYPGVVVTDIRMPGMDGLALMQALHARDPEQPVVLITGHGDIDMAVQAMHDGAFDFLTKPYQAERLLTVIRHAAMQRSLVLQNRALREELDEDGQGPALLGNSEVMG